MRRIAIVFVLVAACDEPAKECENASGGGSSGAVESTSESEGGESTGEPADPTCGELLACYEAECREAFEAWRDCTGQFTAAGCGPVSAMTAGATDECIAETGAMMSGDMYTATGGDWAVCVYEGLSLCLDRCGGQNVIAFEIVRLTWATPPQGGDWTIYSNGLRAHCL